MTLPEFDNLLAEAFAEDWQNDPEILDRHDVALCLHDNHTDELVTQLVRDDIAGRTIPKSEKQACRAYLQAVLCYRILWTFANYEDYSRGEGVGDSQQVANRYRTLLRRWRGLRPAAEHLLADLGLPTSLEEFSSSENGYRIDIELKTAKVASDYRQNSLFHRWRIMQGVETLVKRI